MNEKVQEQHLAIDGFLRNRDSVLDYIIILDDFFINFVKTDEFATLETTERENVVNIYTELKTLFTKLVEISKENKA